MPQHGSGRIEERLTGKRSAAPESLERRRIRPDISDRPAELQNSKDLTGCPSSLILPGVELANAGEAREDSDVKKAS